MPDVMNNGADVTITLKGERFLIPAGESEQPDNVIAHPLCQGLMATKSPIMQPKGEKGHEYVQMMGYRLQVDGQSPKKKKPTKPKAKKPPETPDGEE
jgi:hypothetical protein